MSIQPGEERNDFYVVIDGGEFSQDRKRTAKNVEISVTIRDNKGREIEVPRTTPFLSIFCTRLIASRMRWRCRMSSFRDLARVR